jgi:hypothetical protein
MIKKILATIALLAGGGGIYYGAIPTVKLGGGAMTQLQYDTLKANTISSMKDHIAKDTAQIGRAHV